MASHLFRQRRQKFNGYILNESAMTSKLSNLEQGQYKEAVKIAWFRHQLQTWALDNLRDFPWRRTTDPYSIFVAEFLLQKTGAPDPCLELIEKIVALGKELKKRYDEDKTVD